MKYVLIVLVFLAIVGLSIFGYVNNILLLLQINDMTNVGILVLRVLGVFPVFPLGIVMGYIS